MDVTDTMDLRAWWRALVFAAIAGIVAPGLRAADPKIAFNIPAGNFSQSVIEFYKQTQVEILYASTGSVGEVRTKAVVGTFGVSDALSRMLEGTEFTFEFENPHSVLLKRMETGSAAVETAKVASAELLAASSEVADATEIYKSTETKDVVVTGTYIHGVLDLMSPLVRLDRKELRNTAYATVQDALQALPMNSGAAPSDDFGGSDGNYNRGTAPNLRGLGFGATLVLVNGRRQPLAGAEADFVDTSNIPWSAIERIEVLPDGASALYGSDAIAGVINIVMREDLDGAETQGRFASALGQADEKVVAQLFGDRWASGKWLFSYQYSERGALAAADRSYAANADKRPLGGTDHRSLWGNPGNILDPITLEPAYGIPRGQDGTALAVDDLRAGEFNLSNMYADYDLMPQRRMHSVFSNASQRLGDHLEIFAEGRIGQRDSTQHERPYEAILSVPKTNPFFIAPFGGKAPVAVAYSFLDDLGPTLFAGKTRSYDGMIGLAADFGRAWHARLFTSYGREDLRWIQANVPDLDALNDALADPDPSTAFNPFGDGSHTNPATVDAIRTALRSQVVSDIRVTSAVADGPIFELPTGAVKLAVGAERRAERLHQRLAAEGPADFGRHISSIFAELSMPLVGKASEPRSLPRLELSLAGRYEEYSDFGSTFNPKFGVRWIPLQWLKLRTSWGTSFRAPKLLDLYDDSQNASFMLLLPDPTSATGRSLVLGRQGANSALREETATTWTAGIDVTPTFARGLALSVTYYDVGYENRVLRPGPPSPFDILLQESQWKEVITRNPSQAQIKRICRSPDFFGSPRSCMNSDPAAIVDYRLSNLAIIRTRGVDVEANYLLDTRHGGFEFGLIGNYVFDFPQAFTRTAPLVDVANTVSHPLAMRFRGSIGWTQHGQDLPGFTLGAVVDHTGGYRDTENDSNPGVAPFTTVDLHIGYRTDRGSGWLSDTEFSLNAVNISNASPPFIDNASGYDVSNSDPVGRVIGLYTRKSW